MKGKREEECLAEEDITPNSADLFAFPPSLPPLPPLSFQLNGYCSENGGEEKAVSFPSPYTTLCHNNRATRTSSFLSPSISIIPLLRRRRAGRRGGWGGYVCH